jgi:hypothetical protein
MEVVVNDMTYTNSYGMEKTLPKDLRQTGNKRNVKAVFPEVVELLDRIKKSYSPTNAFTTVEYISAELNVDPVVISEAFSILTSADILTKSEASKVEAGEKSAERVMKVRSLFRIIRDIHDTDYNIHEEVK